MRNKTDREIRYKPQGFSLRVGERLYSQSIGDASGTMPPKSDTPAYFAVTGTPTGGRNDISTKNDFTVLLDTLDEEMPKAARKNSHDNDELPSRGKGGFAK